MKNAVRISLSVTVMLSAAQALAQCGKQSGSTVGHTQGEMVRVASYAAGAPTKEAGAKDIVDTAIAAGSFKTLVAAAQAAGLVEALKGDGPLTVFAPTDEAFAKLPVGTVETLLKPENKERLATILKYHVVAGQVMAKDVVKLTGADTLAGQRVDVRVAGDSVKVDNANVVKADVTTSNGVIHVIDAVILPSEKNIVATAANAKAFGTLLKAATAAGLAETLANDGPFTVFAPTDEAFAKLPAGTLEDLLKPENKDKLATILLYHVVAGRVYSNQAGKAGQAATLAKQELRIKAADGKVMVNDAQVVNADLDASNGVIHVIDTVLLPK